MGFLTVGIECTHVEKFLVLGFLHIFEEIIAIASGVASQQTYSQICFGIIPLTITCQVDEAVPFLALPRG